MTDLLSIESDAKTVKGTAQGWLTAVCYLAPHTDVSPVSLCPFATPGCMDGCLKASGMMITPGSVQARENRTLALLESPATFRARLHAETARLITRAQRRGLRPALRPNGTSDRPDIAIWIAAQFPILQVYDYTKVPATLQRYVENKLPENYHVTFSRSETNGEACRYALEHGVNVAVPFGIRRDRPTPAGSIWKRPATLPATYRGFRVLDGDVSDLRFLDPAEGSVIGLRAKGPALRNAHGFVVDVETA